jgi:hypothetical protein
MHRVTGDRIARPQFSRTVGQDMVLRYAKMFRLARLFEKQLNAVALSDITSITSSIPLTIFLVEDYV